MNRYRTAEAPRALERGASERALWRAVLEEACDDVRRQGGAVAASAWDWFQAPTPHEPVASFGWTCTILDLEPRAVLASLPRVVPDTGKRKRSGCS